MLSQCSTAAHRQERRRSDDSAIRFSRRSHFVPPPPSASFQYYFARFFWQQPRCGLSSALDKRPAPERPAARQRRRLPIYTIICALYREAPVVEDLVACIRALDYPREKLDVIFVIEADDDETSDALAGLDLGRLSRSSLRRRSGRAPSRRRSTSRCRWRAAALRSSSMPKIGPSPISSGTFSTRS